MNSIISGQRFNQIGLHQNPRGEGLKSSQAGEHVEMPTPVTGGLFAVPRLGSHPYPHAAGRLLLFSRPTLAKGRVMQQRDVRQ